MFADLANQDTLVAVVLILAAIALLIWIVRR